jgi:hypothetical protein
MQVKGKSGCATRVANRNLSLKIHPIMIAPQAQELIDNTEYIAKRLAEIAETLDTISEHLERIADSAGGTEVV